MDVDATVVTLITEMTKIPAALKTWRPPVVELLNDNRLFNCNAEGADKWKPIMKSLFDLDKTAFPELLGIWVSSFANHVTEFRLQPRLRLPLRLISSQIGSMRCCSDP